MGGDDALPPLDPVGLALRELEHALVFVHAFVEDVDLIPDLRGRVAPLFERYQTLRLVLDVDQHGVRVHAGDPPLDDGVGPEADPSVLERFFLQLLPAFSEGLEQELLLLFLGGDQAFDELLCLQSTHF